MTPRKGMMFKHTRFMDPSTNAPLVCKVTKIAGGTVYCRPFYGYHDDGSEWLGSPWYFRLEEFKAHVADCPECGWSSADCVCKEIARGEARMDAGPWREGKDGGR